MFSHNNFQHTIKDYCRRVGWKISEIDDNHAKLLFTMPSGQDQFLYIVLYQSTLEFSVPSAVGANQIENMPHEISTLLLRRSANKRLGFWCIEEIRGNCVYSYMHNAEMELINLDYFANIVRALVLECEEVEEILRNPEPQPFRPSPLKPFRSR